MLIALLVLAAIQLGLAAAMYALLCRDRSYELWDVVSLVALIVFFLATPVLNNWLPLLNCPLLAILGHILMLRRAKVGKFVLGGVTIVFCAIVLVGLNSMAAQAELARKYPVESLGDRLAYEKKTPAQMASDQRQAFTKGIAAGPGMNKTLDELEQRASGWQVRRIADALRQLHASKVEQFVSSEGFGVGRFAPGSSVVESRRFNRNNDQPFPQEAMPDKPQTSAAVPDAPVEYIAPPAGKRLAMQELNGNLVLDFARAADFGYVQDRDHVIGFLPHGLFDNIQAGRDVPHVVRLDLVSLLKFDEPRVYVTESLPRMEELRTAPTRPLDAFERQALAELRAGGELETAIVNGRLRALGPVRAMQQCAACHAAERGELLGAFSYDLGSAEPGNKPAAKPADRNGNGNPAAAPL